MKQVTFPMIELVDRLTIARLKFEKTQCNQSELDYYENQVKFFDFSQIENELYHLQEIHRQIWNLEFLLKTGQENKLSLEEIGQRAIEIRNLNNRRVALKNAIAEKFEDPVREIKKDHLSE